VGDKALVLGTEAYTNSFGEDFTVTTLNYFISNVSFKKEDGTVVKLSPTAHREAETAKAHRG